jgi:hypothetical protein
LLAANNPTYASLPVTQKPSWVCTPSSYSVDSSSSLVVAFKDPLGANLKSLLADQHLFAFGTRATIKKWKQRTTKHKPTSKNDDLKSEDEEDVEILTRAQTPTLARPAESPPLTPVERLSQTLGVELNRPLTPSPPQQERPPPRQTRAKKISRIPGKAS